MMTSLNSEEHTVLRHSRALDYDSPSTPSPTSISDHSLTTAVSHCNSVSVWTWIWFTLFLILLVLGVLILVPFRRLALHVFRNYVDIICRRCRLDLSNEESFEEELQVVQPMPEACGDLVVLEGALEQPISQTSAMERSAALCIELAPTSACSDLGSADAVPELSASRRYSV